MQLTVTGSSTILAGQLFANIAGCHKGQNSHWKWPSINKKTTDNNYRDRKTETTN